AMLISSLVIFPALTSMRIWKSFKSVVISSGILAVICFCIGMIVSYQFSTPAGASVVLVNLCAFAIFFVIQKIREHI
ncbi:MAG: metal ABC transporter permease, partial [Clostridium sp.]